MTHFELPIHMESKRQGVSVIVEITTTGLTTILFGKRGMERTWKSMRQIGESGLTNWKAVDEWNVLKKAGWEEI